MGQSINSTSCHDIFYVKIKSITIMVICSKGSSNILYAFPLIAIMKNMFMPHQTYLCHPWNSLKGHP